MKLLHFFRIFAGVALAFAMVAALIHSHKDADGCDHCAICALGPASRRKRIAINGPELYTVAGGGPDDPPCVKSSRSPQVAQAAAVLLSQGVATVAIPQSLKPRQTPAGVIRFRQALTANELCSSASSRAPPFA